MSSSTVSRSLPGLGSITLPATLKDRINQRNDFSIPIFSNDTAATSSKMKNEKSLHKLDNIIGNDMEQPYPKFILYLPTVNLRKEHNPSFALACHLANAHNVPLLVLAVVLDDFHLPQSSHKKQDGEFKPIVFTARRIAFVLEALQEAVRMWEEHGAGVAIRVHGPQARSPHHLSLARKALAVVR